MNTIYEEIIPAILRSTLNSDQTFSTLPEKTDSRNPYSRSNPMFSEYRSLPKTCQNAPPRRAGLNGSP